jgi:hypothetical protein
MKFLNNAKNIPQSYGVAIAGGLIAYFLVMKVAGLSHHVELRLLNLFILIGGVYLALKKFKSTHQEHLNYFRALITGVSTSAIASVIFAAFLFLYLQIDSDLMTAVKTNEPMGRYLNPYIVSFVVALEGILSGLLVTFILINYVETDEVNVPQG